MAQNTDIVEIAQAVEDKLMLLLGPTLGSGTIKDRTQIQWAIDELPQVVGDFDVVLRIRRTQTVPPQDHGGGRVAIWASQVIDVFVRSSSTIAKIGDDKDRIRKHVRIERHACNCGRHWIRILPDYHRGPWTRG